jgi:hypothetical protein
VEVEVEKSSFPVVARQQSPRQIALAAKNGRKSEKMSNQPGSSSTKRWKLSSRSWRNQVLRARMVVTVHMERTSLDHRARLERMVVQVNLELLGKLVRREWQERTGNLDFLAQKDLTETTESQVLMVREALKVIQARWVSLVKMVHLEHMVLMVHQGKQEPQENQAQWDHQAQKPLLRRATRSTRR